jgi:hypothetical protein
MIKPIAVCILLLLVFCSAGFVRAATQDEILGNPQKYPELEEYRRIFFENLRNQDLDWPEKCQKIIAEYRQFLKKYPESEFSDEAKLRIAEFYQLSWQKEKSLPWLNDIIKSHPKADYFSLAGPCRAGVKTAAWALYYRGLWFPRSESIDDWQRVLKEYPESEEVAELAKSAISKHKNRLK